MENSFENKTETDDRKDGGDIINNLLLRANEAERTAEILDKFADKNEDYIFGKVAAPEYRKAAESYKKIAEEYRKINENCIKIREINKQAEEVKKFLLDMIAPYISGGDE